MYSDAQQRETGVDHRRELAREDRDVLQLDPVGETGIFRSLLSALAALLLDLDGHVAHRAQLADDELRVVGLELTLDQLSRPVADLV